MAVSRYEMTVWEFETVILPCLARFAWVPSPHAPDWHGEPMSDAFWRLSSPDYHVQASGRDKVLGKFDDLAVLAIIQSLRQTYERLKTAAQAEMPQVKVVATEKQCPCCRRLDGTLVDVADLIAEYRAGCPRFPHPLPSEGEPRWCAAPYFLDTLQPREGDDPGFHAWLSKNLGR